jgi:hypothetical protein
MRNLQSEIGRSKCRRSACGEQSASGLVPSKTWRWLVASMVFLASVLITHAQSYSIDWSTMDGGGGTSTGGVYSVTGTVGQPDAGVASGGVFTLHGGYWALPVAVQTTNAPVLLIVPCNPGLATVSWNPPTPGYVLQESPTLTPPNWTNSPTVSTNPIVVPAALPVRFYRLFKP